MAWTPNREELAWAAGFFDGEGSTYGDPRPRLQVVQNHREELDRFDQAIGGLGKLGGGTRIYGRAKTPIFQYRVSGWRDVQAATAMLWPFLCSAKREQATRVLVADKARREQMGATAARRGIRRYSSASPRCGEPHPGLRVRDCRTCTRMQTREWRTEMTAMGGGQ